MIISVIVDYDTRKEIIPLKVEENIYNRLKFKELLKKICKDYLKGESNYKKLYSVHGYDLFEILTKNDSLLSKYGVSRIKLDFCQNTETINANELLAMSGETCAVIVKFEYGEYASQYNMKKIMSKLESHTDCTYYPLLYKNHFVGLCFLDNKMYKDKNFNLDEFLEEATKEVYNTCLIYEEECIKTYNDYVYYIMAG